MIKEFNNLPNIDVETYIDEVLEVDKPVMVWVYHGGNPIFAETAAIVQEFAKEHADQVKVVLLDYGNKKAAPILQEIEHQGCDIKQLPCAVFFKDGRALNDIQGRSTKKELEQCMREALKLVVANYLFKIRPSNWQPGLS